MSIPAAATSVARITAPTSATGANRCRTKIAQFFLQRLLQEPPHEGLQSDRNAIRKRSFIVIHKISSGANHSKLPGNASKKYALDPGPVRVLQSATGLVREGFSLAILTSRCKTKYPNTFLQHVGRLCRTTRCSCRMWISRRRAAR